jgi:hypothetical protein
MFLSARTRAFTPSRSSIPQKARFRPTMEVLEERCLLSGDEVLRWNSVALQAAVVDHGVGFPTQQFGPTRTSRAFAIEQIAIYDAVAAIDGTYTPFLTTLPASPGASMDAAIAQAGHDTLAVLYSHQLPMIDGALAADLAAIPDGPAKTEGIALGTMAAVSTLAARQNDGSQVDAVGQPVNYTFGQQPGQWRSDPLHPTATPLTPDWGSVKPFVMSSGTEFRLPPPPALNSPEYTAAYDEVKSLGGGSVNSPNMRTSEQTTIGLFWGYDAQPGLCAPVRFYNQIAQTIAIQEGNTEVENARLLMLVNVGMADAGIACWGDKYFYSFWRPVTAIRESDPGTGPSGLGDGNPDTIGDPLWTPLGAPADNNNGTNFTPPFPSYPSGHADFGGALFTILKDFYGTDNISFTINSDEFNTITVDQNGQPRPLVPRSYTSFSQAMFENGESRIYLGIHFNFDMTGGIQQGSDIGNLVFAKAGLKSMDSDQAFVNKLYRDLLNRQAEPAGLAFWVSQLQAGMTHTQMVQAIQASAEYRSDLVTQLYASLLHRAPDSSGMQTFTNFFSQGGTITQAETMITGSSEYFSTRGGGTNAGFLDALYQDALHRAPDTMGLTSFEQMMNAGATPATVSAAIWNAAETRHDEVAALFTQFLRRQVDLTGSIVFYDALQSGVSDQAVIAAILGSAEYGNHL